MKFTHIANFSLWAITAFVATGLLLSFDSPPTTPLRQIADVPSATFSSQDVTRLFALPAQASAPPKAVAASDLNLQGIIYSSNTQQSRAVIADKHYALGSPLPNGGTLTAIEKKHIEYNAQGQTLRVALPKI